MININVGGTFEYGLTRRVSLVGELLLSFEGGKSELKLVHDSLGQEILSHTFKFTKLNLPILLKYNLSKKVSVEVGAQMGIFLKAKCIWQDISTFYSNSPRYEFDLLHGGEVFKPDSIINKRGVAPLDISFLFSVNYNVYKNIHLQARYVRGFSPIDLNMTVDQLMHVNSNFKSSVLQLSAVYKFPGRKRSQLSSER